MHRTITPRPGRAVLVLSLLTLVAACAGEAPLSPVGQASGSVATASSRQGDLGSCDSLAAAEGGRLALQLYARGVQIYRWDGTKWVFVAPSARLYPNEHASGQVGIHYAGPTWESVSGSKVVGSVMRRCSPNPNAIPWLLLGVVSSEGPGIFHGISQIQRLETTGGNAPAAPGSFVGELANIPYTAEYRFYRAQ
jgi:hypothetical protein